MTITPPEPGSSSREPQLLHDFFTRTVARYPDRIAVDIPPSSDRPQRRQISYAELDRLSSSLAGTVREAVRGESMVAILLPRTSERIYLSQLAVLRAGAAYVGLDPSFPDEQLIDILADLRPVLLITDAIGAERTGRAGIVSERVVDLDTRQPSAAPSASSFSPAPWQTPDSLAYAIYTSGTTGRPKGVLIEHKSIVSLVHASMMDFDIGPADRIAQGSSSSYDSSVEEIWLALATGATLVVMDDDTVRLGPDLVPWLQAEGVTVLCPPPTLLRAASCADPMSALPELRMIYVGGEALPPDVADRWGVGRLLINGYGPTECTVTSVRGIVQPGKPITIGTPVSGFAAWVLGPDLQEVVEGEKGELCMGGPGLARGYHNQPELTAQKFPVHPRLGRICRTGDLVHRDADGHFHYHGRIDSQVKVRGYRIELEAIETRLAQCAEVREAACQVQGTGGTAHLAAFLVPTDPGNPPDFEDLKTRLRKSLPAYMVPGHFAVIPTLPRTVSGKVNRSKLPEIVAERKGQGGYSPPRTSDEEKLAAAFGKVLGLSEPVSIEDNFFNDLGGDSLKAALVISLLRDDPATASLTVRDLYQARTVARLVQRIEIQNVPRVSGASSEPRPETHATLATCVQVLSLVLGLLLGAPLAYLVSFHGIPLAVGRLGLIPFLLLAPAILLVVFPVYSLLAVLLAVLVKKLLIGRYVPLRAPVWGSFYVRNWLVRQTIRLIPWGVLTGTVFQNMALRALGARIGRRVHLHRGVGLLQGGWDLLDIGDEVTLSQDSALQLVELSEGEVIVSPVTLGRGTTLETRASVGGDTYLEEGTYLTALSHLPRSGRIPRGQRWEGIPAQPAGEAPPRPTLTEKRGELSPGAHGLLLLLGRFAIGLVTLFPLEAAAFGLALVSALEEPASLTSWPVLAGIGMVCLSLPVSLIVQALLIRALGPVPSGVISRWSSTYIRIWLKTGLVDTAGRWLSGTLFWPVWLRWAGMKVGGGCEISTIIDVVPSLVEIGEECFFADGIYLGGPRLHRGTVTLGPVSLGKNTFLGNHAVIAEGQRLPEGVLLGICTVADGIEVAPGTSWFGLPHFELPRREVVECDRSLTHNPPLVRYWNRVFWELLRFALPVLPFLLLVLWLQTLGQLEKVIPATVFFTLAVPALTLGLTVLQCSLVVALKWILLGRVRPGVHPLWSCWCCRWDFLYVTWDNYARGWLSSLEGTLLLPWYLRAMGASIGRRVVLGSGFAQVVDPDMLHLEDGATVNAMFQAHTFEDRVLKIDRVTIRREATVGNAAVLLYGADIGAGAYVLPHSVVMKQERLLPGRRYAGCPTRPVG